MRDVERRAADGYLARFGAPPALVASAPGRVNLLGEHTDYNEGFVLPFAIDRRVACAIGPNGGELFSCDFQESRPLAGAREGSWADYPRGVVWALREAGYEIPPFRAAFAGDVPVASGLSSSAAIEAATALALSTLGHLNLSRPDLALLCQRAENGFVGVQSGIMDQYASLLGEEGSALLLDCRTLVAQAVPLHLRGAQLSLLICDTRVRRALGETAYDARRRECDRVSGMLGLSSLRDAGLDDLERLTGIEQRRARHVVTENQRVLLGVEALRRTDFEEFGRIMRASHASLRDDYEVSVPQLDAFVESAMAGGALGARLTGAGFGGCAIALVPGDHLEAVKSAAYRQFQERGFTQPEFYAFAPSAGAELVPS